LDYSTGSIRVQSEEHRGFERFAPAHDADQRVDVLRPDFNGAAAAIWNQILPDKRDSVIRFEPRCKSGILETRRISWTTPELPIGFP
jgi:hypothetical protein